MNKIYGLSALLILSLFACEKKEDEYYSFLTKINSEIHAENQEGINSHLQSFNAFVEQNKLYAEGSFLSKTAITESVSFLNCVEAYSKILGRYNAEKAEQDRWNKNLQKLKDPAHKASIEDPEKVYSSIQSRLEGIDDRINEIGVELTRKKISCDSAYSKVVSLTRNS